MCKACRECGSPVTAKRVEALFCSPACRKSFNNRRMVRGAELYDLMMANRYERDFAKDENMLSIISNLCRAYRDSDKGLRDGRKSWNAKETMARLPISFGLEGDKR